MRKVEIKGFWGTKSYVTLFDSVKELSWLRQHELNRLFMMDLNIGSDMRSVSSHHTAIREQIMNGNKSDALQELKNLYQNYDFILKGININSLCFMAMVRDINGRHITDFSAENVRKEAVALADSGLKGSQVADIVDDVKKNFKRNFNPIFLINSVTQESITPSVSWFSETNPYLRG